MNAFSLNDAATGIRFLAGLPAFLRRTVASAEARQILARRLERRDADFCALAKAAIFGNPQSPYLALLRNAGCEYGDLESAVAKEGLDATLRRLLREGVYLTVGEFKGRVPIRRGGMTIPSGHALVRNPLAGRHLLAHSSGRSGQSVPVLIDLAFIEGRSVDHFLALEARGGLGWRHAIWGVPGNTDMVRVLELHALGAPVERWFSQVDPASPALHPRYRWSARLMRWAGRVQGRSIPAPEYAPLDDPTPLIRWITQVLESGRTPHVVTWASGAVRICQAAAREGVGLSGAQFSIGGEPITRAKLNTIRRTGAAAVPRFMAMECGYVGYGCLQPSAPDEVHLVGDMHAVIQAGEDGSAHGLPAGALLLSSLRSQAPFILLNTSLGDEAEALERPCGCPLEQLGWVRRVRGVRSFERLTACGMTFLDADILKVLEEALPARFGGSLLDYQLVEDEEADGGPRLTLVVSPSVGPLDAAEVTETFLEAVGSASGADRVMSLQWREAGLLSVARAEPALAPSGKIVHLLRRAGRQGSSPGRAAPPVSMRP